MCLYSCSRHQTVQAVQLKICDFFAFRQVPASQRFAAVVPEEPVDGYGVAAPLALGEEPAVLAAGLATGVAVPGSVGSAGEAPALPDGWEASGDAGVSAAEDAAGEPEAAGTSAADVGPISGLVICKEDGIADGSSEFPAVGFRVRVLVAVCAADWKIVEVPEVTVVVAGG